VRANNTLGANDIQEAAVTVNAFSAMDEWLARKLITLLSQALQRRILISKLTSATPVLIAFGGPGFFSVASQLTKRIPVTETAGFDIGVTAYNLFNYPNFAVPNGNSLQVLSG